MTSRLAICTALLGITAACQPSFPEGPDALGRVPLAGGRFVMGSDEGMPDEYPAHPVKLSAFWLDPTEVTVADFARFVAETGYETEAERHGWSGVLAGEWRRVENADWRRPEGTVRQAGGSEPVTQVSWSDAQAYCRSRGGRLPTEAEFEYAARGGRIGARYAWGDQAVEGTVWPANWWQGPFPDEDLGLDGYRGPAPVRSFAANDFGLYDLAGNVWEWCQDRYDRRYYRSSPSSDPQGPSEGEERVIRGGSWACSPTVCEGFRAAARSHAAPDSALNNLGFRCAADHPVGEGAK